MYLEGLQHGGMRRRRGYVKSGWEQDLAIVVNGAQAT